MTEKLTLKAGGASLLERIRHRSQNKEKRLSVQQQDVPAGWRFSARKGAVYAA